MAAIRAVNTRQTQAQPHAPLDVCVLFTTVAGTLEALRSAARLASELHACIRLVVPQIVPYPMPLNQPPVCPHFLARRFRTISEQAQVDTSIDIRLCRDPWNAIDQALAPHAIVVLGGHRRWWPTRESRIAKRLRAQGHQVVFTEMS